MRRKKLKLPVVGDIVEVKWYDASTLDEWTKLKEIDPNLQPTYTYGIVSDVNETETAITDTITIAGSIVPGTQTVAQFISIPNATIEFINVLEQRSELITSEDEDA